MLQRLDKAQNEIVATVGPSSTSGVAAAGPGSSTLLEAVREIDAAESQAELLGALLKGAGQLGSRALFVLTRPGSFVGWAGYGFSDDEIESLTFDVTEGSSWAAWTTGTGTMSLDADQCAELLAATGVPTPQEGALIPFVLRGSVLGGLYLDRLGEGSQLDVGSARVLTWAAANALETLPLREAPSAVFANASDASTAAASTSSLMTEETEVALADLPEPSTSDLEELALEDDSISLQEDEPEDPELEAVDTVAYELPAIEPLVEEAPEAADEATDPEAGVDLEVTEEEEEPVATGDLGFEEVAIEASEPAAEVLPEIDEIVSEGPAEEGEPSVELPVDEPVEAASEPEPPAVDTAAQVADEPAPVDRATLSSTPEVRPPEDLDGPGWAFSSVQHDTELDSEHEEARRLARLLVTEIKLYNEEKLEEGRERGNVYEVLREDIDRSRQIFDERVEESVRQSNDYFHDELVRILAGGDSAALGI